MKARFHRWIIRQVIALQYFCEEFLYEHDICECCGKEQADSTCIGCERRICSACDSGYYEDEQLCEICRKEVTPEMEAADRLDQEELDREMMEPELR